MIIRRTLINLFKLMVRYTIFNVFFCKMRIINDLTFTINLFLIRAANLPEFHIFYIIIYCCILKLCLYFTYLQNYYFYLKNTQFTIVNKTSRQS